MKQKTILISIIIIFTLVLAFLGTTFVYAAENEETTTMVFEKVNEKEEIDLSMDIVQNEGVTSFQTNLKFQTSKLEDIKNVNINWAKTINDNASLKTATYNKDTGVLNIYVVSRIELTEVNKGNVILKIGTITFETKNEKDMTIDVIAGNTVFGNIIYNSRNITASTNTEKTNLNITAKVTPEEPTNPDNPGGNTDNPGDNPSSGNNNDAANTGNNSNGQNQNEDNSKTDNKYNGISPFTGLLKDYRTYVVIALVILVIALIALIILKKRKKTL